MALDVGDRRIGVAISDPSGLIARPLTVIARRSNLQAAETIRELAERNGVELVVVGVPLQEENHGGLQAIKTLAFARFLRKQISLPIETWDERFSTADAEREMIAQGIRRSRRREMLDAAAAAVILDDWLNSHRPPSPHSPL
ncbi:MAG TPA: Holliday junction resolvase RuvX [Chloroflexota bacterium]|nr:Holliday junction resolvase RuvX [Chloroflexota bacterium]